MIAHQRKTLRTAARALRPTTSLAASSRTPPADGTAGCLDASREQRVTVFGFQRQGLRPRRRFELEPADGAQRRDHHPLLGGALVVEPIHGSGAIGIIRQARERALDLASGQPFERGRRRIRNSMVVSSSP